MIRILIVDDQNLVQQGIKSLLDRDLDLKVIGTVRDGRNALQQIAEIHPDIVLLDIEMPGMDGITTTKYINRVSPKTKVIILSSHEEKKYVTQALMAGAKGYLLKSSLMTDLKQAILAVNNGYSQIDSRLLAKVFNPKNIRVKKSQLNRENTVIKEQDSSQDLAESLSQLEADSHQSETENAQAQHQVVQSFKQEDSNQDLAESLSQLEADSHQSKTDNTQAQHQVVQSFKQEDSNQDLAESLSQLEADSNQSGTENAQAQHQVAHSLKDVSLTSPQTATKAEDSESVVKESYVVISDEKAKSVPSTVWTVETDAYSKNQLSDSVVLKQISQDYSPEFNQDHQETSSESNQTILANVSQKFAPKPYKLVNPNIKPKTINSAVKSYYYSMLNSPKVSLYKAQMGQLKSRITREKTRLLSLIKQKQKRRLVENIALVILGIVVVVILGSL